MSVIEFYFEKINFEEATRNVLCVPRIKFEMSPVVGVEAGVSVGVELPSLMVRF